MNKLFTKPLKLICVSAFLACSAGLLSELGLRTSGSIEAREDVTDHFPVVETRLTIHLPDWDEPQGFRDCFGSATCQSCKPWTKVIWCEVCQEFHVSGGNDGCTAGGKSFGTSCDLVFDLVTPPACVWSDDVCGNFVHRTMRLRDGLLSRTCAIPNLVSLRRSCGIGGCLKAEADGGGDADVEEVETADLP